MNAELRTIVDKGPPAKEAVYKDVGQSLAVGLDVGDGLREFVEIAQGLAHAAAIPPAEKRRAKGAAGLDQSGEAILAHAGFEEAVNHFARGFVVVIADADGTEEHGNFGMQGDEAGNSLP